MQEHVSDPLIGALVDNRYAVLSKLDFGGMSTVYLAVDQRLEREVALKVLHPHLAANNGFLDHLGREAKAAARLSHPNVVGVFDQNTDAATAYLVMEYIKGHTLRDVIKAQGRLTPRAALDYIEPVVAGLAAAHAAGMIHRDVKPENVLIATDGRVKIGDFGLSRAVSNATSTGQLIGTAAYLSPELVEAKPADARSDVYSVGIMLFEMLTGQQPYAGETAFQVAYQHVTGTVAAPSSIVPGLTAELDELVQWCTAKDPENRPVNGGALLAELHHIRSQLTDAELDLKPAASRQPQPTLPADPRFGETAVVAQQGVNPTEFIARNSNPTTILPAARTLTPPDNEPAHEQTWTPPTPTPTKREQRRNAKESAKADARVAATPTRTLHHGNPRRRGILWVVALVLVAILATGAGWFFGLGPGAAASIPAVSNKTVEDARIILEQAGFSAKTSDVFDDDVPDGLVVGSDPAAGAEIRKFIPISLFVSKGPQLFPLSDLTGGTLDAAKAGLNAAEMALGTVTEQFDEKVAVGVVLSQNPAAGTDIRRGTPVALVVSKGPQPLPVPSVVGQRQKAAVDAIKATGLVAEIAPEEVFDAKVPEGSVVSQSPANGTLTKGGTVTLTISKGPKLVDVPSFVGKQAAEAEKALQALGFEVRRNNILGGFFGTVRSQDPVNTKVPEGSVITITVV